MNLTNDNPVAIADSGGLKTISSLTISHFPVFISCLSERSQFEENIPLSELNNQNEIHLTNHKIDFLVAILGLLVNMVENDRWNRSQIAAASVSLHITLPHQKGTTNESHRDVIPLLCSIFLANQGVSEAAGEDCFHRRSI